MFGKAISNLMIKPGKSPVFETPAKYNLSYQDVTFKTADGITLSGWLLKGNSDKVIVPIILIPFFIYSLARLLMSIFSRCFS